MYSNEDYKKQKINESGSRKSVIKFNNRNILFFFFNEIKKKNLENTHNIFPLQC